MTSTSTSGVVSDVVPSAAAGAAAGAAGGVTKWRPRTQTEVPPQWGPELSERAASSGGGIGLPATIAMLSGAPAVVLACAIGRAEVPPVGSYIAVTTGRGPPGKDATVAVAVTAVAVTEAPPPLLRRPPPEDLREEPSEAALYSARRAFFSPSESMWKEFRMRMSSGAMQKVRCFPGGTTVGVPAGAFGSTGGATMAEEPALPSPGVKRR
eukprot:scaffold245383_cov35-Tisochrysis_lutea.AAC.4